MTDENVPRARFPRTAHVVNGPLTGKGVARDDLLLSESETNQFVYRDPKLDSRNTVLTIEEKVDGSNLGISLAADGGSLRFQNRSHFVNAETASQWKPLSAFVEQTRHELLALFYALSEDETVAKAVEAGMKQTAALRALPSRVTKKTEAHSAEGDDDDVRDDPTAKDLPPPCHWILFGEWLVAQHSVLYAKLPSPFLVFDIFHSPSGTFLSTNLRNSLVETHCPSLCIVPALVSQRAIPTAKPAKPTDANPMPQTPQVLDSWGAIHSIWYGKKSSFTADVDAANARPEQQKGKAGASTLSQTKPGLMEGIVLRIEDPSAGILIRRCKAVHNEFTAGIESDGHWTGRTMVKNGIVGTFA